MFAYVCMLMEFGLVWLFMSFEWTRWWIWGEKLENCGFWWKMN